MKSKQKRCKANGCGKLFTPYTSLTKCCSITCALQYNQDNPKELKTFIQIQQEKELKTKVKSMKEGLKNHSYWIKALQIVFNSYIRERDKDKPCICCLSPLTNIYHAGHFFSVGAFPALRFDKDNCHAQREDCNLHKHGNSGEYAINLPKRIGQERFEALYNRRKNVSKLSIPEIKDKIIEYKLKIKTLQNETEQNAIISN